MKLLAIDGNSIMNRAFYGIKILTTRDGMYTNAIYGFLNILIKMREEVHPDAVAIAFDVHAKTFRHKAYDGYKATRKGMPEELRQQVPILKQLLRDLGYTLVECEGFEADDLLGTLSGACQANGDECVIATGDRDSLQLIGDHVTVRYASTRFGKSELVVYDVDKIQEVYGLAPRQLIDVKALMGDSSDNIPGVAGIGEKTALALIQKFGSLDAVYENIEDPFIKPGVRAKLIKDKEMAYHSRFLAEIVLNAPIETKIQAYQMSDPDAAKVKQELARLEIFKLTDKLLGDQGQDAEQSGQLSLLDPVSIPPQTEQQQTSFEWIEQADEQRIHAFLRDYKDYALFYQGNETSCEYLLLAVENQVLKIREDALIQLVLCDTTTKKIVFDGKVIYRYALSHGYEAASFAFISNLAAYLLDPNSAAYDLARLCEQYQIVLPVSGEAEDQQKAALAIGLYRLSQLQKQEIAQKDQTQLLFTIEQPLCEVLASMEHIGFDVDTEGVRAFGESLNGDIDRLQQEIYTDAGCEFNINSPKQLGEILFVTLGLPAKKKTKSGFSTNAEVLEDLRPVHPIVDRILEYRKLMKLRSTYVEGLLKVVGSDGRIHTSFNQTETRTGRISSTEPNLQNIPVRTELGRNLRRYFEAGAGNVLIDADYSQIELRVLAHIANDENMIGAFLSGEDIHTNTAAQVFGFDKTMVPPLMRSRAKAVNFGIVYGIGAFSLSKDIGVSVAEADQYIKGYLNTYSGVKKYMEDMVKNATEKGYITTMFGRRRYLPELSSSNKIMQAFGKRVAMNAPIQGTAADIIKLAMIKVYHRLKQEKLDAHLILQVHDELILESSKQDAPQAAKILKQEMEQAVQLLVPMDVDIHEGKNWFDAKA